MIELMTVAAIAAVLIAIALPSFQQYLAGKRVEGIAGELATDLQYARSEAISRNANVRVTFIVASNCYVVHQESLAVSTCASSGTGLIKTMQIPSSSNVSLAMGTGMPSYVSFEATRGTIGTASSVVVSSSVSSASLQVAISSVGRPQTCKPSGSNLPGFVAC